jgi:Uncharacterized conserved protein
MKSQSTAQSSKFRCAILFVLLMLLSSGCDDWFSLRKEPVSASSTTATTADENAWSSERIAADTLGFLEHAELATAKRIAWQRKIIDDIAKKRSETSQEYISIQHDFETEATRCRDNIKKLEEFIGKVLQCRRKQELNLTFGIESEFLKIVEDFSGFNGMPFDPFAEQPSQDALNITSPATHVFGLPYVITASGGSGTGALSYSIVGGTGAGKINGNTLNISSAGTIILRAVKAADKIYLACASENFILNIGKIPQEETLVITGPATRAFGEPCSITTSGGSGTGNITYSIEPGGTGAGYVSDNTLTATRIGTIILRATKAADKNYDAQKSAAFTMTIAKAKQKELTISSPATHGIGTPYFIKTTGGSGSGAITYSIVGGTATGQFRGDALTASAIGTIRIRATKAADENYHEENSLAFTLTVGKARQKPLEIIGSHSHVAGEPYSIATSGGSGKGNLTYSIVSGAGRISGDTLTATSVGVVTLRATKEGDDDYSAQTSADFKVTFEAPVPIDPAVTWSAVDHTLKIDLQTFKATKLPAKFDVKSDPDGKTGNLYFRYIKPGKFIMGSPSNEWMREKHENQVSVTLTQGFYIGVYELTEAQFNRIMKPGSTLISEKPKVEISWDEIRGGKGVSPTTPPAPGTVLANLRSRMANANPGINLPFDLPTEAQWEYACRAGTKGTFSDNDLLIEQPSFGLPFDKVIIRYKKIGGQENERNVTDVGIYSANSAGLYGMHGNVGEWCLDAVIKSLNNNPYMESDGLIGGTNPIGTDGDFRIYRSKIRKDAMLGIAILQCRSASRACETPNDKNYIWKKGLRLCATADPIK